MAKTDKHKNVEIFSRLKPTNPFFQVSRKDVLSDLEKSRAQIATGQGMDMEEALKEIGNKHGFI